MGFEDELEQSFGRPCRQCEAVFHILGPDHVARAFVTPAAKLGADGVLTYPVEV